MDDEVVALGARCELVPADVSRASPGSITFDVDEFAVLADGRRIVLHQGERGFSLSGPRPRSGGPLGDLSAVDIASGVLTTVLPDEDDGEEHPWEWLADLLHARGVAVAPDALRSVPYTVELSERVQHLLAARGAGGCDAGPLHDDGPAARLPGRSVER